MPGPGSGRHWGKPVPEPRDELDTWLGVQVEPLLPPPGTFERVSTQARRLRTRRAALAAAGALAVAAIAAVAVPQLVFPALEAGRQASATGPLSSAAAVPQHPATEAAGSTPAPVPAGPPGPTAVHAPPPLSVTFVGAATGWVMGQSLPAGQCDRPAAPACIVLRRTDSGGATWRTVHAPPAHGPNGPTGVSQIRFLTRSDGWAFGPQLWATHNAGRTWTQIATGGLRVTALEARGRRVFAVWARCTGTGADFASRCTSFTVYSSPAGGDAWAPALAAPASGPGPAGGAASLLLTGTTAYLLSPAGSLFAGPLTGAGLQPVPQATGAAAGRAPPCPAGAAQPDGQPSGALLAAGPPAGLDLLCTGRPAGSPQSKVIYASADGGQTWRRTGQAPAAGTASFLSASPSGALVLATSLGIEVSTDGGATWSAAGGTMPPGGFAYAGMTTDTQGVAVPAGPAQQGVWLTYDGGRTWQPSSAGG
jgi:BNR/Asp-box repeat